MPCGCYGHGASSKRCFGAFKAYHKYIGTDLVSAHIHSVKLLCEAVCLVSEWMQKQCAEIKHRVAAGNSAFQQFRQANLWSSRALTLSVKMQFFQ